MAEIINLRRARKARKKDAAANDAAGNRVRFGRTKAERTKEVGEQARVAALLDGARRKPQ